MKLNIVDKNGMNDRTALKDDDNDNNDHNGNNGNENHEDSAKMFDIIVVTCIAIWLKWNNRGCFYDDVNAKSLGLLYGFLLCTLYTVHTTSPGKRNTQLSVSILRSGKN